MDNEYLELFLAVQLLEPFSHEELEQLVLGIPVKSFEISQHVYTPAYRGEIVFLLLQGRVRIYRLQRGHEVTLSMVEAGEIFGEAAFAPRRRKGMYAEALRPCKVALVNRGIFARWLERKPQVGLKAIEQLSNRLSLYEERIADLSLKEVRCRLAGLILELARSEGVICRDGHKIPTRYTHEQLGTMIGAKRVAVTRALTGLRKAGAVEVHRGRIHVRNAEVLKRAAA